MFLWRTLEAWDSDAKKTKYQPLLDEITTKEWNVPPILYSLLG
jgi:predicted oxidoreductase (fatty acid repression mutant protein)